MVLNRVPPKILDVGTDGFVLASSKLASHEDVIRLYRAGHLRGLVVGADQEGYRAARVFRKSPGILMDINAALEAFVAVEMALVGMSSEWVSNEDMTELFSRGTVLTVPHMLEVLVRV
jgi:hypothetical protein